MSDTDQNDQAEDVEMDEEVETIASVPREAVRRKPSPTPFDHPLSFPILMGALTGWFFRDGWFNPAIEHKDFNKWMFWICLVIFALTLRIGLREMKIKRERKAKKAAEEAAKATVETADAAEAG